ERCYDAILAQGFAFHASQPALVRASGKAKRRGRTPRRVGHNLLLRLSTRKQDVLRFLSDPAVPFTNNQAERDGRMMKLRQKISGGFRSEDGAADFGVIRSLLSTAKARLGYAGNTHRQPTQPDRGPARRLIWPAKPGQLQMNVYVETGLLPAGAPSALRFLPGNMPSRPAMRLAECPQPSRIFGRADQPASLKLTHPRAPQSRN